MNLVKIKKLSELLLLTLSIIYAIIIIQWNLYITNGKTNDCALKHNQVYSLSGIKGIFIDEFDNIYCFYEHSRCIGIYDTDLNLQFSYYLPNQRNGEPICFHSQNKFMVKNTDNLLYCYENGEFSFSTEYDSDEYNKIVNDINKDCFIKDTAIDSKGNIYSINHTFPSIYKNGNKVITMNLLELLTMYPIPAILIEFFSILLYYLIRKRIIFK